MFEARAADAFKSSRLTRDLCCYLPHGADADLEFPSESQSLILHFPPGFLARQFDPSSRAVLDPAPGFRNPALANIMEMIEGELAQPGFGHDLMLDGLYRCVASVLSNNGHRPEGSIPDRLHISPAKLRRVIDYIDANLAEKVTIKELADVAGISMFHFSRVFKKAIGQSPYQYVRSRRLMLAQSLMQNDANGLAEIGLSCGFASQSHFSTAFVKETGISPGRYRRALLQNG